jgi:hypothetical protein
MAGRETSFLSFAQRPPAGPERKRCSIQMESTGGIVPSRGRDATCLASAMVHDVDRGLKPAIRACCYFPKRSFVGAIGSMELRISSFFAPLIASNTLCTTSSEYCVL